MLVEGTARFVDAAGRRALTLPDMLELSNTTISALARLCWLLRRGYPFRGCHFRPLFHGIPPILLDNISSRDGLTDTVAVAENRCNRYFYQAEN